ncbi:MAG: flippase [Candidatus Methanoperedens sp.]|nr:flippase [Candidatus Methanoperedens sp.]
MSEIVNKSLQKVAKGTAIIFIGTIIGMFLAFIGRVIIIRYTTQSEYGIFSIALVLLNILALVSTLGLQQGVVRQIAYFMGKEEGKKVNNIIKSSIQIILISSFLFSISLFILSDVISSKLYHIPELSIPLKIFAITIPFFVFNSIFSAIFRGFGKTEPNIYFQNILINVLQIICMGFVIIISLSFINLIYAFSVSIILTCTIFAFYTAKKIHIPVKDLLNNTDSMKKSLLIFSLPLMTANIMFMVITWTDTLMLGYFTTPDVVGLYNSAVPLAHLIPVVLSSMLFLYVPIASQLYSQNLLDEMKRNYAILTKWIFSLTLPLFFIMFLFPETLLSNLFGSRYVEASAVLKILSLGMFVNTFLGPNAATLMTMGKTRFLMLTNFTGAILNILLNLVLIPSYGIMGAAIASAISISLINFLNSTWLYLLFRIHPFTKNYMKPVLLSILMVAIISTYLKSKFIIIPLWMLIIFLILFTGLYGISILITKSIDKEDLMLLLSAEKRLGLNLTSIKNFMKSFI